MPPGASIFQNVNFAELIDRLTRYYVLRIGLSNDVYWPVWRKAWRVAGQGVVSEPADEVEAREGDETGEGQGRRPDEADNGG